MLVAVFALSAAATQPNLGYRLDGQHLLETCTSSKQLEAGICAGYISGVIDQSILEGEISRGRALICVSPKVSALDLVNVVTAAIRADVEKLGPLPASAAATKALFAMYPCDPAK